MRHVRWQVEPAPPDDVAQALSRAGFTPLEAQLLHSRGLDTPDAARRFLDGGLEAPDDPLLLTGMSAAADRLNFAIQHGERVAVYGDYDTDGVTATALLVQVLRALGADAMPYIPDREEEGYGLNVDAVRKLKLEYGAAVVVTVDCGVRSVIEAQVAREVGLDMIITDHHQPGAELPDVLALINPLQPGDEYPDKNLAGVGLAYKLAQGLIRPMIPKPSINGRHVLDLVALGTVADLARLVGENRVLVRQGLAVLNQPRREGLKSLMRLAHVQPGKVDASSIGFGLGPRLNAAGRLESALAAYDLLTTDDLKTADDLARKLDGQNRERQDLTRTITERAREIALQSPGAGALLFAVDSDFKSGVVGLAASRLAEEFYRPAVVGARGPDVTRASARSIPEFHLTEALDECADLLVRYGGHAAAAGFTVRNEDVDALCQRLQALADAKLGHIEHLRPTLRIDADKIALSDLSLDVLAKLQQFEPCGYGNPRPVLASHGLDVLGARAVGADARHLKLTVGQGATVMDAIAFRQADWLDEMPGAVDLAYQLEANEWNNKVRLQLNVRAIRPAA